MRVLRAACGALFVGFGAVALATPVTASVIYTYVGNPYFSITDSEVPGAYTTSMFITARIELTDAPEDAVFADLTDSILSYEVSDGRVTLTEVNSAITFHSVSITNGQIYSWWLDLGTPFSGIGSLSSTIVSIRDVAYLEGAVLAECLTEPCTSEENTLSDVAQGLSRRDGWTLVPEPGSQVLLAGGLAGLAAKRARTKRGRRRVDEARPL